jgi:hypothetical protein
MLDRLGDTECGFPTFTTASYCCSEYHAITVRTVSSVIAFHYVLALLVWNDFWYGV